MKYLVKIKADKKIITVTDGQLLPMPFAGYYSFPNQPYVTVITDKYDHYFGKLLKEVVK